MPRPKLSKSTSVKDFKDYYWLKKELIEFCREYGISSSGGKIEISNRILHYFETGIAISKIKRERKASNFDWKNHSLDLNTIITDNYRNTENVRNFFKQSIGQSFKFNVEFMDWMKSNAGKTLSDAIDMWKEIHKVKNEIHHIKSIQPQFEYNTYIRDFLKSNPDLKMSDAIKYWKVKRSMPGDNVYCSKDLMLMNGK